MENSSLNKVLDPQGGLPPPTWVNKGNRGLRWTLQSLLEGMQSVFLHYVIFRRNKAAYLRHLGVRIGSNCSILNSVKSFGSEPWLIELGNRVTISGGVLLITHDGSSRVFRHLLPGSSIYGNRFGTIRILDNSFVGAGSILLPDVRIGPNSIVGAGSVVSQDVPPNTVVAGVPARQIYTLEEYVQRYQQKMISIKAQTRKELRRELTLKLWGETR